MLAAGAEDRERERERARKREKERKRERESKRECVFERERGSEPVVLTEGDEDVAETERERRLRAGR